MIASDGSRRREAFLFSDEPSDQVQGSDDNVYDVILRSQHQLRQFDHVVRSSSNEVTDHPQQAIDNSENDAELAGRGQRPL